MKFTSLFTTSLLLSISKFASAANLVDQDSDVLEKVYVNANGDIVIPEVFPWGRIAVKEKNAAKNRTCGGHVDASGRLGKRTPTCPYGYAIACDAYATNPCCPVDTPLCCSSGSSVCCGDGQFCQGTRTCCNIGQVGCGEACCEYGQVCCGSNCCSAGFTCSATNTCVPPPNYTSSSSSSSSSSTESSAPPTRSPPIYTTATESNPYGYNPSYTPTSNSTSVSPTCTAASCTPTTPPAPPPSTTNIGIVGGVLGAFCLVLILIAAWLFWRKRHAEHLYAEACAPKPVEDTYTPEPKPAPPTNEYATPAPAPAPAPTPAPAPPATYTSTPAPPATNY